MVSLLGRNICMLACWRMTQGGIATLMLGLLTCSCCCPQQAAGMRPLDTFDDASAWPAGHKDGPMHVHAVIAVGVGGAVLTEARWWQGPLECSYCRATQTGCWRRHHRTRALLCNRCGVQVNPGLARRGGKRPIGRPRAGSPPGRRSCAPASSPVQAPDGGKLAEGSAVGCEAKVLFCLSSLRSIHHS